MPCDIDWLTGTIRWGEDRHGDKFPWEFAVTVQNVHGVAHLSAGRGDLPRLAHREIGDCLAAAGFERVVWEKVRGDGSVSLIEHPLIAGDI